MRPGLCAGRCPAGSSAHGAFKLTRLWRPECLPGPENSGGLIVVQRAEQSLGLRFLNPALLEQALVHRSYLNEATSFPLGSNERLEYLGDAVLELVVSDFLFHRFP